MNKQELIQYLQNNEHFDDAFKQLWVSRIQKEGLTSEVLDQLKAAIVDEVSKTYAEMGVEEDTNDPEYQAEHKKMMDELQKIDDELESAMTSLVEEGNVVFKNAVTQMEEDQKQAVRDSM